MAPRRYRFNPQLLTLFFLIGMPLTTFGSFLVVAVARGALRDSVGQNLEQRALQTKILLERYIGDQIIHVRLLATDPQVRQTLMSFRSPQTPSAAAESARRWLERGDRDPDGALTLPTLLAHRLRETVRVMPSIRLLQVVNRDGWVVASSSRVGRPNQRDSSWFSALSRDEVPGVYVGEIYRPSGSAQAYIEIAHPIFDPSDLSWIGATRALVSAADLYGVLAPVRLGYSGRAILLNRSDGMILASDEADRVLNETFPGFPAIQAAITARRGYWIVPETERRDSANKLIATEPARLVGFAIVDQVPGAHWIVAVEQDLNEAVAPITGITRYLWFHFGGTLATVLLLGLYLSFRQVAPVIPEALHLHDTHVPPSMHRRETDKEVRDASDEAET